MQAEQDAQGAPASQPASPLTDVAALLSFLPPGFDFAAAAAAVAAGGDAGFVLNPTADARGPPGSNVFVFHVPVSIVRVVNLADSPAAGARLQVANRRGAIGARLASPVWAP